MFTAILALIGPYLVPILGGLFSGVGINLLGALSTSGGKVAARLIPLAIRMALRVRQGEDATQEANELISKSSPKTVAKVTAEIKDQ